MVKLDKSNFAVKTKIADVNQVKIKHKFSSARVRRGIYKSSSGQRFNADVYGSYNIMRKAVPTAFSNGIEDAVVHPVRLTPAK